MIGLTGGASRPLDQEFIAAYPNAFASPSSFNNFWGVPLTLCNGDPAASAWVVEMGMNQVGEISRLSELSRPTVALVVNVQPVHLEKLGSLEAIRREKVSIVQGLPKDGVLVLPPDVNAPEWKGKTIRFGANTEVHEVSHTRAAKAGTSRRMSPASNQLALTPGARIACKTRWPPPPSTPPASMPRCSRPPQRGRHHDRPRRRADRRRRHLIDDSFNGNPASMVAALDSLKARPVAKGRRIAILGDMLELGDEAPTYHTGLAKHLDGIDGVYCVGPLMHHLYTLLPRDKGLGWHEDHATLEPQQVASLLRGGDVVVVKGSKKMFWVNKFVPRLVAALQAKA